MIDCYANESTTTLTMRAEHGRGLVSADVHERTNVRQTLLAVVLLLVLVAMSTQQRFLDPVA